MMIDSDAGVSIAPPIACTTRAAISRGYDRRDRAEKRPEREQAQTGEEHPAPADPVGEPAGRDQQGCGDDRE